MKKENSSFSENQKEMETCGLSYAVELLRGRWKINVLWGIHLGANRFGLLKRALPMISEKMLTQQLKSLEEDGLLVRKDFKTVPPHVEYQLTEFGKKLAPTLQTLCNWGDELRESKVVVLKV